MKVIYAKGSFGNVGAGIGEAMREEIRAAVEATLAAFEKYTRLRGHKPLALLTAFMHQDVEKFFPEARQFMLGLWKGSAVRELHDVLALAYAEYFFAEYGNAPAKCSTLVVETERGVILGHNEDYDAHYLGKLVLLDLEFDGWPRLVSVTYPGHLPGLAGSLNAERIATANNSMRGPASCGIPKSVRHFRASLARTWREALDALRARKIDLADHFTLVTGDRVTSVEVSPDSAATRPAYWSDVILPFAHANHPLWLAMRDAEPAADSAWGAGTHERLEKLRRIGRTGEIRTNDDMLDMLACEDNLLHKRDATDGAAITLATVAIDTDKGEFLVRDHALGAHPATRRVIL